MEEHLGTSISCQERVAHVIWAAHILAYLSKAVSHPPSESSNDEEEEHEDVHVEDFDTDTEIAATLTGTDDLIQTKVLDCIAQLFSPAKGWAHVTATAVRQREDFVEIDIARNDSFRMRSDHDSLHGNLPGFALRAPEAELCEALTRCLSAADQSANCDESPPLVVEFERSAIAYAAKRIDHWVGKLQTLLGSPGERRQGHNGSARLYTPAELTAWQTMTNLLRRRNTATGDVRECVVRQAYKFGTSLNCRILLFSIFESTKASKIWSALLFLSRPLTDVRMLWCLAGRCPEYRDIRVLPVRRAQQTSISPQYQVDITTAWSRLNSAAPSAQDLRVLGPFGASFRSDCSKAYSLHAEMQLVDYYESGGAQRPTKDYFGCSKKSCFLCESFLRSLPSPVWTRGRHGICYPAWGIPCPTSSETAVALDRLKDILVCRIKIHLQNERRLLLASVPQSTLVPDLSDSVLQRLTLKDNIIKEAVKGENDSREQQRILKGIGLPSLPLLDAFAPSFQPEDSCVMCNKAQAKLCTRCRSCYYCSSNCQKSDWACHKRLCSAFAEQPPRPSPSHKRAIFFPVNRKQPQVIWVPCERIHDDEDGIPFEMPSLEAYFEHDRPLVASTHIDLNSIRGRLLGTGLSTWAPTRAGYSISLKHRETFLVDGSSLNRSLLASVATSGTVSYRWCGPLVAMRETYQELYEDITAGDFRHLIDYVTSYLSTETPESGPDPHARAVESVRGVKLSCYGEERLHGSEPFISVEVPWSHPARGDLLGKERSISPISKLLGVPLRLWKYSDIQTWIDPPGWEYNMDATSNQNAAFLMIETDFKSSQWGWAPFDWDLELGNVLVVREDEQDLDVDYLRLLCRFVRVRLQPMVEDALGSGTVHRTREEVRDFITKENLDKFSAATNREETSGTSDADSS